MKTGLFGTVIAAAVLASGAAFADTTVPAGRFHSVSIEGMGHVTFVHGAQQRVVLKEGDTHNTHIYVKDGDLVLKSCMHEGWFGWGNSCPPDYELSVEITTPGLSAVEIDGSGKIDTRGPFPQQPKLDVEINGSGSVDLTGMPSGDSNVTIRGSGKVRLAPHDKLDVEIMGSGSVVYAGTPRISQSIMGSGEVKSAR